MVGNSGSYPGLGLWGSVMRIVAPELGEWWLSILVFLHASRRRHVPMGSVQWYRSANEVHCNWDAGCWMS